MVEGGVLEAGDELQMSEVSELNKYLLAVETRTPMQGPQTNQAIVQQLLVDVHHLIDIIRAYKYTVDRLLEEEDPDEDTGMLLTKCHDKTELLAGLGSTAKWGA